MNVIVKQARINPINQVFENSNLLQYILSFISHKSIHNFHDFIQKTPFLLYMLTFKSLYYEALKRQYGIFRMKSSPYHYISSFSQFQWAIKMGYSGKICKIMLDSIISINKEKAVEFIDYLHDTVPNIPFPYQHRISCYAAEFNYMHLFQWLQTIQLSNQTVMHSVILSDVAKNGNLANLQLLFHPNSLTYELSQRLYSSAAQSGNLDMLIWLQLLNPSYQPQKAEICTSAVESNHLHILQWLRSQNPPCQWDENTCRAAAYAGNLSMLQWLRSQNPPCPWDEMTSNIAIEYGNLPMLQWIRSQNPPCPWEEDDVCSMAVQYQHFDILQWLRSQEPPCAWDEKVCTIAMNEFQLDILEWIQTQNPPIEWDIDNSIEKVKYQINQQDKLLYDIMNI